MSQIHKLAQLDKHQIGMAEVPSSILTAGNILLLIVLFSCSKSTEANIANFFWFVRNPTAISHVKVIDRYGNRSI